MRQALLFLFLPLCASAQEEFVVRKPEAAPQQKIALDTFYQTLYESKDKTERDHLTYRSALLIESKTHLVLFTATQGILDSAFMPAEVNARDGSWERQPYVLVHDTLFFNTLHTKTRMRGKGQSTMVTIQTSYMAVIQTDGSLRVTAYITTDGSDPPKQTEELFILKRKDVKVARRQ